MLTVAQWQRAVLCENSGSQAGSIGLPQCAGLRRKWVVTVHYAGDPKVNEPGDDVLELCEECRAALTKDAERHGYAVSAWPVGDLPARPMF